MGKPNVKPDNKSESYGMLLCRVVQFMFVCTSEICIFYGKLLRFFVSGCSHQVLVRLTNSLTSSLVDTPVYLYADALCSDFRVKYCAEIDE